MRHLSTATIAVLLITTSVRGDIVTIQNTGNTIMPCQETDISMDAEVVVIQPLIRETEDSEVDTGEYKVFCLFLLTCHAHEPVAREIAFPVAHPDYARWVAKGFRVHVERHREREALKDELKMVVGVGPMVWVEEHGESEAIETELKMIIDRGSMSWADITYWERPHDTFDYPGYVTWEQTFDPGETQLVQCEYPMGRPAGIYPCRPFTGEVLEYVVRTGALWKGKIGEATIMLRLGRPSVYSDRITMTYPRSAQWELDNVITWHFTDWEPTEDITLAFTRWTNYDTNEMARNHYPLPHPYRGAREEYTEPYLDGLVEREICRVAEYYPERVQGIDKAFIRSMIAEYLFYELFARHGDAFVLGAYSEANLAKYCEVAGSWSDTFIFSRWESRFKGYGYHGGWYSGRDPETGKPNPPVKLSDLSPKEELNAAFLRRFIERPLIR